MAFYSHNRIVRLVKRNEQSVIFDSAFLYCYDDETELKINIYLMPICVVLYYKVLYYTNNRIFNKEFILQKENRYLVINKMLISLYSEISNKKSKWKCNTPFYIKAKTLIQINRS